MITLLFVSFFILFFLRIPVAFALFLYSLLVIIVGGIPPLVVIQKTFEGMTPFPILAIPLFYLVGILANTGGFTDRIMTLARALVGGIRAGLAHVNIVASMLFAGVSGSSTADTAGIGAVLIPQMLRAGYSKPFTVAVTACSSTMGNIIPPSIMMVIYGAFGNVSIGMLFLGGFIPGLLLGFGQMAMVYVIARRYDFGLEDPADRPRLLPSLWRGLLPFGVPVVIIGGIVGGVFTPTESAAVALVYVLALSLFYLRELTLRSLWEQLRTAGLFVPIPLIMVATAVLFGWVLAYHEFPETMVEVADLFGATEIGVFFFVAALFLVLGCFLDVIPAVIMFLPVIQTMGDAAGIHPVHLGVVVVLTSALGLVTPPYGVCLLVASQIADVPVRRTILMTLVVGSVSVVVILLAIFIPDLTLFLPRTLMPQYF